MALPVYEFDPFAGRSVTVRPARPDDLLAVGAMLARLSPASSRLRFFSPVPRPRPRLVRPLVEVDHLRHETLVALCGDVVIGIAEFVRRDPSDREAEVAVVVDDGYQREGVARFLFRALARRARRAGVDTLTATVMPANSAAVGLARSMSDSLEIVHEHGEAHLRIPLGSRA